MKRYRYFSLLLFVVVLLSIVCFHSSINLKDRVKPPSEMWGRHITLGITDYKKIPAINTEGTDTIALFADENGFQRVVVDGKGFIVDKKTVSIKDYRPDRLVKYQLKSNKLFWTENYDLFYTELGNGEPTKKKLLSDIVDFELVDTGGGIAIAAASNNSIALYEFSDNGLTKPAAEAQTKGMVYINAIKDSKNNFYIAGVSRNSPTEYGLMLWSYDSQTGRLIERIEPALIENNTTTREGSNSINNLELGIDEKNIYIFYEIGKASSQGMVARTYMGRIPTDSKNVERLTFERLKLDDADEGKETYISSLRCLDGESDKLSVIITTPIKTSVRREGSELVYLIIKDGKVVYKSTATNTGQWNSLTSINKLGDQLVATFLQTKGGNQYEVNLTSTAEGYKGNINRVTASDIKYSVMDTVGAYVFSFFVIFINLITVSLVLLWAISVDFFEWKFFFRNPLITFRIGALAETFLMYFSIRRIYRNAESVTFMPDILKHGLSPIVILLITAAISYIIVRLYKKSKSELSSFQELALFVLVHNIFVYFLYTAYIARF